MIILNNSVPGRNTMIRIRIPVFTLTRIRLFTLIRIRIRIQLGIKMMQICDR
jgi:hypothetical protein